MTFDEMISLLLFRYNYLMSERKKILVCPLDWGLGHATRCIPIIRELIKQGSDVYIGADKRPLDLLKKEFPDLKFINIPGINVNFPQGSFMFLRMIFFIRKFMGSINKEHKLLEQIIIEHKFDVVISDNRYGLWNNKALSVFITHQIVVKVPAWLGIINSFIYKTGKKYIHKFDKVWIPDIQGENNLSGDLSHLNIISNKTSFIGILSRFHKPLYRKEKSEFELCVILSGINFQSIKFYQTIVQQIKQLNIKTVIFTGMPLLSEKLDIIENLYVYNHLTSEKMQEVLESSKVILSRSGYSTIMDLATIGKNAIFIPTPGQTEQEYLAKRLTDKGLIYHQTEKDFNLELALKECEKYKGLNIDNNPELLIKAVKEILDM
jgi:uncharacterized protein (TIGR00661 family)